MKKLWMFLIFVLVVTGCGKLKGIVSREPTANDCKKVLENLVHSALSDMGSDKGHEYLQILSAEKIKSYEKTEMGTPVCYVETRFKIKCLNDFECLNTAGKDVCIFNIYYFCRAIDNKLWGVHFPHFLFKGEIESVVLNFRFEKTNKGWLGYDGNLY